MEEMLRKNLEAALRRNSSVVMMELPAENYFESSVDTVGNLLDKDYDGVYVSFQRPFNNLKDVFEQKGLDRDKLWVVDVASAVADIEQSEAERCTHIPEEVAIDDLVRAIYTALDELEADKRFVFIDSLTTITLYKPLSEILRFSEFLTHTVEGHAVEKIVLIFNVAHALAQKQFIQDIALHVDEVVRVET